MTIRGIVLQLLSYIGVYSLDPDENTNETNMRGLQTNDLEAALAAVNGAMQDIYAELVSLSEKPIGLPIYPPTAISFTATKYSTTISAVTGWQAWMAGCTVHLSSGDSVDNELMSATTLLRPYMGGTGTVGGTVYCDAILLPSEVKNVLPGLEVANVGRLTVANSRADFRYWNMGNRTEHPVFMGEPAYLTTNKTIGDPRIYMTEAVANTGSHALPLYLRLNPMPMREGSITMRVRIKPPIFTQADIGEADDEDPATPIPSEWNELILLPLARKRFMSHPSVDSKFAIGEINEQARAARRDLASFKPQIEVPPSDYQ